MTEKPATANCPIDEKALLASKLKGHLHQVAAQRSKEAFAQLFAHFAPKIKQFGIKQLGNEAKALDLVQETMSSVWTKAHLYNPEKGAATTWVYTIMRNASFDMLRKVRSQREDNLGDAIWPLDAAVAENEPGGSEFKDHLQSDLLKAKIDALPEAQRVVVKGVYFQELSQEMLAKQLDIPLGTVKSRLRLALSKLKAQLGDRHD